MKLLTVDIHKRLVRNGRLRQQRQREEKPEPDFWPVVKLFTPDGACAWLLTEIDPDEPDIAFGLCDLGFGCLELGSVSLSELASVGGRLGLAIERDLYFTATKSLSAYADEVSIGEGFRRRSARGHAVKPLVWLTYDATRGVIVQIRFTAASASGAVACGQRGSVVHHVHSP